MSETTITKNNFKEEVINSDKPVLIDFWASWCGSCRALAPVLEEFAVKHSEIKVGKVNVDEQPELAQAFGVMSIPTLVYIKDGKTMKQTVGFQSAERLEAFIQ